MSAPRDEHERFEGTAAYFERVLSAALGDARRELRSAAKTFEREAARGHSVGLGSMSTHILRGDMRELDDRLRKVEQARAALEAAQAVSEAS